jgi:hypothetical protein
MAIAPDTLANILFKKSSGKGSTDDAREFFEEPYNGRIAVFKDQVWTESDLIPATAPVLAPDAISGVVQYKEDVVLTAVPGAPGAFQSNDLKDVIPFNFDGVGSYNYTVKDNLGANIPFGLGDWLVDGDTGTLTFYGTVPANMPPTISFYKYVGTKGDFGSGGGGSATLTIVDKGLNPSATVGDDADTGLTISLTPPESSYVEVVVNGLSYIVGNGVKTESCYFEDPTVPGVARFFTGANRITSGDKLIWNGLINEFNLEIDDTISLHYSE